MTGVQTCALPILVRENGDIGGYALDIFKNARGIKAKLLELESSPKY